MRKDTSVLFSKRKLHDEGKVTRSRSCSEGWSLGPDPVVSLCGPPCHGAAVNRFTSLAFLSIIGKKGFKYSHPHDVTGS